MRHRRPSALCSSTHLPYVNGEGYASFSTIILWTSLSMASVLTPGCSAHDQTQQQLAAMSKCRSGCFR